MKPLYLLILLLCLSTLHTGLWAQTEEAPQGKTSIQLSQEVINPTTLLWQVQLEENVLKYNYSDDWGQKFRLRLIIPLNKGIFLPFKQLIRVIGFYNTVPEAGSGLGTLTFNQFWILGEKDWGDWGLGYNLNVPVSKDPRLGTKQWALGPAFTLTLKDLGNWQMYYIIQNFFSLNDNDKYGRQASMVFQPNIFYTWKNGIYTGLEPLWKWDFTNNSFDIPLNWRIGYIFQSKKYKFNVYVEPEWKTYRSDDYGGGVGEDFGVKFGFRIFLPEGKG